MRRCIPPILILALLSLCGSVSAQTASSKIYLLADNSHGQWCTFSQEAERDAELQVLPAPAVYGSLRYTGNRLSQIDLTWTDPRETKYFAIADSYLLDGHAKLAQVTRRFDILRDDPRVPLQQSTVIQTYRFAHGKAKLVSTAQRKLNSDQPLHAPQPKWLPTMPVWANTRDLPFIPLLIRPDLLNSGTVCGPEAQSPPHTGKKLTAGRTSGPLPNPPLMISDRMPGVGLWNPVWVPQPATGLHPVP